MCVCVCSSVLLCVRVGRVQVGKQGEEEILTAFTELIVVIMMIINVMLSREQQ